MLVVRTTTMLGTRPACMHDGVQSGPIPMVQPHVWQGTGAVARAMLLAADALA